MTSVVALVVATVKGEHDDPELHAVAENRPDTLCGLIESLPRPSRRGTLPSGTRRCVRPVCRRRAVGRVAGRQALQMTGKCWAGSPTVTSRSIALAGCER